ncbi:alpha/beta fold hydrolase [Carbonactinospora thermoautotrophica]|uniref:alpha/beta fold hydrolase n=2 Tax=Carbonactinospora thermoautotrophica TaxID=1469144 RepID=UPI00082C4D2A|nr:hypothetical protein [Carbonactinospora thermoautotrophica]
MSARGSVARSRDTACVDVMPTTALAPAGPNNRKPWDSLPLWQEIRTFTELGTLTSHPVWTDPPLDAAGLPVVLVGGLSVGPRMLNPLRTWLERANCRPIIAPTRYGVGCGEATAQCVQTTIRRYADRVGEPVVVIGYSRGGQFSRASTVRDPEPVRALITLASPLRSIFAVHPILKAKASALGMAGTLGVPGLMRFSCLWGACCRSLRQDLRAPFPAEVPFVSIYSEQDTMVDWRSCLDTEARHRHICASHLGMIASPQAFLAIAEELSAFVPSR